MKNVSIRIHQVGFGIFRDPSWSIRREVRIKVKLGKLRRESNSGDKREPERKQMRATSAMKTSGHRSGNRKEAISLLIYYVYTLGTTEVGAIGSDGIGQVPEPVESARLSAPALFVQDACSPQRPAS
jgi:hypothetical protein